MAKKKKRPLRTPPLGGTDRLLYVLLIFLGIGIPLGGYLLCGLLMKRRFVRGAVEGVAAFTAAPGRLLQLPLPVLLCLFCVLTAAYGLTVKQPILGDGKIRYGSPGLKEIYPLLGPQRRKPELPEEERVFRRKLAVLCAVLLLLSAVLFAAGTARIDVLRTDGVLERRGLLGSAVTDAASLAAGKDPCAVSFSTAAGDGYRVRLSYEDGASASFSRSDFLLNDGDAFRLILRLGRNGKEGVYASSAPVDAGVTAERLGLSEEDRKALEALLG